MRGQHARFVRDAERIELRGSVAHHVPVAVAAHHEPDLRSRLALCHAFLRGSNVRDSSSPPSRRTRAANARMTARRTRKCHECCAAGRLLAPFVSIERLIG